MDKRKVYISGPVTGLEYSEASENFRNCAKLVESTGKYEAVNPLEGEPEGLTWEQYMRRDIKKLMDCDRIISMPGWTGSEGAKMERELALSLGIKPISLCDLI